MSVAVHASIPNALFSTEKLSIFWQLLGRYSTHLSRVEYCIKPTFCIWTLSYSLAYFSRTFALQLLSVPQATSSSLRLFCCPNWESYPHLQLDPVHIIVMITIFAIFSLSYTVSTCWTSGPETLCPETLFWPEYATAPAKITRHINIFSSAYNDPCFIYGSAFGKENPLWWPREHYKWQSCNLLITLRIVPDGRTVSFIRSLESALHTSRSPALVLIK